jgi:NitT/TauT family transport system ATP-binding protein
MLKVTNLRKVYGSGETATEAIADVSFEVSKGEFVCIVGPSGAGKTTLLKTVSGLMAPTAGEVELAGEPVQGPPERMALVFQDYSRSLYPWMKVSENVAFPLRRKKMSKQERREIVEHAVESVGLASSLDNYPWQLSGGMQQRVSIARALSFSPALLLMDEPFGALDEMTRERLNMELLRIWAETGSTVIFVTHSISEAVFLSTRVAVMSARPGRITAVVPIELEQPRTAETREEPRFFELVTEVREKLHAAGADRVVEELEALE